MTMNITLIIQSLSILQDLLTVILDNFHKSFTLSELIKSALSYFGCLANYYIVQSVLLEDSKECPAIQLMAILISFL